ncbi:PLP-dependent aminotransferase family protein [Paenibacillus sp. P32E]|uniref:aminotransferase-like domain-containing protein n=1 Tax=Paenibacillus sp. P32E TaxID=1349434 RepID=UPI00093C504F|nr:PLP-dependent aminotransferase family protein [Paenibacillus sp. P32E]OKP92917.1 GntR family transcriptional regulator [Paenibacillus sp. P32E]
MNFTLPYDQYLAVHRYKYLALYHALRAAILGGTLPGGTRLPSTRKLAELYQISRGSASQVYDMLLADGYIRTETGRGTYVANDSFEPVEQERVEADQEIEGAVAAASAFAGTEGSKDAVTNAVTGEYADVGAACNRTGIPLSGWGQRLMERNVLIYEQEEGNFVSFRSRGMLMEYFPYEEWRSALKYAGGKSGGRMEGYCPPQGEESLRLAIAAHLRVTRGIRAEAEQIVLFNGSMQGIVLLTQLLLEPGSPAVAEDPGFHGIRRAVEISGGKLLLGKVDGSGLVPHDWAARLLFVTPSRQFPTGAVLPLDRRRRLLEWARRQEALIVEDDYDSEFRWGGRPIEPLKALDREERVVYLGSFSNSMFSSLRLGYAVLPPLLIGPVTAAKALYEPLPGGQLEQRALARFMQTGGYSRHLRRMTRLYGERARLLRSLLSERLGQLFELLPGDAGLHIYARWRRSRAEFAAFRAAALRRGTDFRDAALYQAEPDVPAACFSFAHLDSAQLENGVNRLLLAWEDVQNRM